MTEQQVFGVVVRSCGLLTVIYGLMEGLIVAANPFGPVMHKFPLYEDAVFSLFWIIFGTVLIRLGATVARFAYGPNSD